MMEMAFSWMPETCDGGLMVIVNTTNPPSTEEWKQFMALSQQAPDLTRSKHLVFTEGGAPTLVQRKAANDALHGRTVRTAVVSSSAIVRGVVTAMSWFNPEIKCFAESETKSAMRYLDIPPREWNRVLLEANILRRQMGDQNARQNASVENARGVVR